MKRVKKEKRVKGEKPAGNSSYALKHMMHRGGRFAYGSPFVAARDTQAARDSRDE